MYSPTLGRFLQADPIGYGDGLNWYNYVRADPVNATDPSGLEEKDDNLDILVDGKRIKKQEAIEEPLDFGPSFAVLDFLKRPGPGTSNGLFGDGSGIGALRLVTPSLPQMLIGASAQRWLAVLDKRTPKVATMPVGTPAATLLARR